MPRGRPKKYTEIETMQAKIDQYFTEREGKGEPFTMAGLAYALGMDRRSLLNYSADEKFSTTVQRAKQRVEAYAESRLFSGSATGVIFNLVNNFGWHNTSEVKAEIQGKRLEDII